MRSYMLAVLCFVGGSNGFSNPFFIQAKPTLPTAKPHPMHISICEIEYDEERKALEITQRIFLDDLESGIRIERKNPELDLLKPGNNLSTDDLVKEYLQKHLKIYIENREMTYEYIGHEIDGFALYSYVQVLKVKKVEAIKVVNDILLSLFDDQVNIVHIAVGEEIKSLKLYKGVSTGTLTFE